VAIGRRGGGPGRGEEDHAREDDDRRDKLRTARHGRTSERSLSTGGPSGAATFQTPPEHDDDAQTGIFPHSGRDSHAKRELAVGREVGWMLLLDVVEKV